MHTADHENQMAKLQSNPGARPSSTIPISGISLKQEDLDVVMAVAERLANNGQLAKNTRDPESATPRNISFHFVLEYTLSSSQQPKTLRAPPLQMLAVDFLLVCLILTYLAENRRIIIHRNFSCGNRRWPGSQRSGKNPTDCRRVFFPPSCCEVRCSTPILTLLYYISAITFPGRSSKT